ncbi:MAG: YjbQ family protein [Desulfobulbaceae bacterium]|uniref:YjbQ family protein n=1 Tax=Candidatus Desulfatifera sulfidica TaxID=2841691 RepID=A0A8J6N7I3_9BACT|nr:YjbQ family protein [Candidatus Desulfatifera sulfidica]
MHQTTVTISTHQHMELVDITTQIQAELRASQIATGTCILFNPHTTAGLTINEGADPAVRTDLIKGLRQFVPLDYPFQHQEGNSPSHIMATLTGSSLTVLVENGTLLLGTWQKIFFCEYDGPRTRKVVCRISAS